MDPSFPPQKKGLGTVAWLGIGCGGLIVLALIVSVVLGMLFGTRIKQFSDDFAKNPTRAAAMTMITVTGGKFEMAVSDELNNRYTLRQRDTGKFITFYWDPAKKAPASVAGDFSAIPAEVQRLNEPGPK